MKKKQIDMKKAIPLLICTSIFATSISLGYSYTTETEIQQQYKIIFDANGGNEVPSLLYINGDETLHMPVCKRDGFVFGGWYFDDEEFLKPFYPGSSQIQSDTILYAKWVIKKVTVYLDTDNEGEFSPLIYNVGDTFHISSLPTEVKNKSYKNLSFAFKDWRAGNEETVLNDFVLEDAYYEFHATYGALDYEQYSKKYENHFDTDYGYIDNNHSWTRGELSLVKAGIGEGAPTQGIFLKDDSLSLNQMTYDGLSYGAKALLPYEYSHNLKKYSIETTFRIAKESGLSKQYSKAGDAGYSIMVGYNKETGAHVEAVVDPFSKMVRIAAINSSYQHSSTDVNKLFSYPITSSLDEYHKFKVVYDGETPNSKGQLKNSYIEVYFDDVLCYSTKITTLNKNWFYSTQANGDYIGLCSNLCETDIQKVTLRDFEENKTIYEVSFAENKKTFDGWKYLTSSYGASVGQVDVRDGKLSIDSYFKNQSIKKHQAIYSPCEELKDFAVSFDFNFVSYSDIDKYFALMFRGKEAKYNALLFRSEKGQIQLYNHGEKNSLYSSWSSSQTLRTIKNGFSTTEHHVEMALVDDYLFLMLDGEEVFSNKVSSSLLLNQKGSIGFLSSSSNVEIDNLVIYDLEKEVRK